MRYQNWDVLVFPGAADQYKVPLQEFKTACTVIQDQELHSSQTSPHLVPTVTSFIPSLAAGSPFRVSIHCWQNPEMSRYIQSIKRSSDDVTFEARLFVDGSVVGSRWFHENGPWPTVIEMSINVDKNGDFDKLRFPLFHKELLSQSYWNAGDDFGRIKLVISEGFSREHLTYPFERIKNIAAFSFQHAPLEVLEQSNIAWPNQAMWRQVSLVGPYLAQHQASPRKISHEEEVHSHSPRRSSHMSGTHRARPLSSIMSASLPRSHLSTDPFTDQIYSAFNGWRQSSGNDVSMADYSSSSGYTRPAASRQITDPMSVTGMDAFAPEHDLTTYGEAIGTRPPANSPQTEELSRQLQTAPLAAGAARRPGSRKGLGARSSAETVPVPKTNAQVFADHDIGAATNNSTVTIQQVPDAAEPIKSRKENLQHSPVSSRSVSTTADDHLRKVSQTFSAANSSNVNKSQRVVSNAASKVIDDEDEPRNSPSTRKLSRNNAKEVQTQKRVLTNITNNI